MWSGEIVRDAEYSLAAWSRLWAALRPAATVHPIGTSELGEYAMLLRTRGPYAAAAGFPTVATHLARHTCRTCIRDLGVLLARLPCEPTRS
jgi:hypothetical protein